MKTESTNQHPELEVRRKMLEQMRDNLRAGGFEAETNATVLSVQSVDAEQEEARLKLISDHRKKAENAYRGAEALSAQLAKLPKPKKDKA